MAEDRLRSVIASLWWGSLKRPFRSAAYRLLRSNTIQLGPMRGRRFDGTTTQLLGIYEMAIERCICENLKFGDVFFDIGANYGYFTLLGSLICGTGGHVYSFEPLPDNTR